MHADADPQHRVFRPVLCPVRALSRDRRTNRGVGGGEDDEERVSNRPDLDTAVRVERGPHESLVPFEEVFEPAAQALHKPGRAFDVAEEKGQSSGR